MTTTTALCEMFNFSMYYNLDATGNPDIPGSKQFNKQLSNQGITFGLFKHYKPRNVQEKHEFFCFALSCHLKALNSLRTGGI